MLPFLLVPLDFKAVGPISFQPGRLTSQYTSESMVNWIRGGIYVVELPSGLALDPKKKEELQNTALYGRM